MLKHGNKEIDLGIDFFLKLLSRNGFNAEGISSDVYPTANLGIPGEYNAFF